ncbi:MAG: Aminotransferase, class I and II [uncultured Sulfurovum sp.]|uniref:cysteine-S-conjugate beta-lyase n=1 Tax=uncultured Sulfurovum sp. TaxID=269237 RepID=A0A6S6SH81_9BACT|nr:MAG: Aminotransferase, class I and II [uncultured Sulfurovum sp.]
MFETSADRSHSNSEKYTKREKLFGTSDILPLWVADMDIDTPDFILNAIKKRLEHPILGYEEMPNSAFDAQIKWMKKHHNLKLKREEMFFSPSVLTSINLIIQTFSNEEDEIIIQTPVYGAFANSIINNKRSVMENPLIESNGDYTFDFKDLERKITPKTKLLLLCSPHNPIGRVWTKDELLTLASICLKHNIIVIADEIHCDLAFKKHTPFASLSEEISQQTITLLSPAKTFNITGLSISTISISNKKLREQFYQTYKATYLGEGNLLAHVAFEAAYTHGEKWLKLLKEHLLGNMSILAQKLKESNSKIKFKTPEATFLLWLDCRALHLNDEALNQYFIQKKLGLSQGIFFGTGGEGYMRFNIAISKNSLKFINI